MIYDWTTAVPLAISNNEGKTWEKIDKNKTSFQRNNFKNNDYIDTNKKIKYEFKITEQGNVNCSNNKLITLKGAPQKVGGSFSCSDNNLTTLEGAPQEIGKGFDCSDNKLTTLKGAPQEIGKDFDCSDNKSLSKEEIIKYLKVAKIDGLVYTDFGIFSNQKEALKKLTAIKHFSY